MLPGPRSMSARTSRITGSDRLPSRSWRASRMRSPPSGVSRESALASHLGLAIVQPASRQGRGWLMTIYSLDGILPELPPENDYWIAPNAVVVGRVKLDRDVGIWFDAVLRGDN